MLSDHERAVLHEIQRRILVEDPGFAQSFDAVGQRPRRGSPDLTRRAYTISLVLTSTFVVILLAAGSLTGALALAGLAVLLGDARRRAGNTTPRKP